MSKPTKGTPKGGKKGRKIGRTKKKPTYIRYLANDGRAKRKARKIAKYMRKFPNWKYTQPPIRTDEPKLANNVLIYLKRLI